MNKVRCNLVVIRSKQLDAAARFYGALGLRLIKHRHGSGPEHFASEIDTPTFEIYPLTNEATATTGVRIGFAVESVDQVFEHLLSVGGQAVSAPKNSPWGRRAVIADTDGHRVELTSAIEPEEAAGG
ncbi:VOC family protein [Aureliella helgolandensis]|uniref:Glyoxalase-like domain protein n=1 Tax=Aureliella helgolandensis TaxID=2527968 RepID=A0A518GC27_9BACT|nr:VOC family protein [Aureliella helgolandensis]QDV26090.1 Glyoxalase-like domain protein [Aureliella helgolandensis]